MAKEEEEYFDGESYADKQQAEAQEEGFANAAAATEDASGEQVEPSNQETSNISVEVNEDVDDSTPIEETFPGPHQVEPAYVIFVPQQDFEARINQEEFSFQKGVPVKVKKEDANDWVDQERGYVK